MDLPLVAYANRLPVSKTRAGWRLSAGGLVTALKPALEARGGAWVGWDGGSGDVPRGVEGLDIALKPVSLGKREVDDYYHGFANRTLWPLLHGLVEQPVFDRAWWAAYRGVNERFATEGDVEGEAVRWVHDYHLMLLPELLRSRGADGPIAFFLHIPFPAPEIFARLPWRARILDGLLGADVVSFHTAEYRDNFLRTCLRLRDDVVVSGTTLDVGDRLVEAVAHPISIDADDFARRARRPSVVRCLAGLKRQFEGRRLLLGVDRLDYTKGIIERLRAIELLLEQRAELRGEIAFVQVAVPSRGEIREYRELRASVEELVGRINGRFTEPGMDVPIHYLYRGVTPDRLLAYYRAADVCLVTPLQDGMNLVAKEFVTVQAAAACDGVLVLSEFTGAAEELREALPCNPYDVEGLAGAIELALELPPDENAARMQRMAARIHEHDVFWWADQELATATAFGRRARASV
ncbi:MAG TPA: trehalose-6-phosphate synthase [Gaiellaceae bacterium]|nr:trehalose-6-phosphate synthase [Gaiellaceae bacterium]